MKLFEVIDKELNREIGVLLYYEKQKVFLMELREDLDEWTAPLLFMNFVKRGIYSIPREPSRMWVQERVIPSGRQNIQDILRTNHLKEYDEMAFLEISRGICSQDALYIRKIQELPEYVIRRACHHLTECVLLGDHHVLCFFQDDSVKKVDLTKIDAEGVDRVIKNQDLYHSGELGCGGAYLTFNNSIDIPSQSLYASGIDIPLTMDDFKTFLCDNVLDTTQSCETLNCTRQNLAYLTAKREMTPAKENVRGNLYLKGSIMKNTW